MLGSKTGQHNTNLPMDVHNIYKFGNFAITLFLQIAIKDTFATLKTHDRGMIYLNQ